MLMPFIDHWVPNDVVGYRQHNQFVKGCNMISPSFLAVAAGTAKLSDWKPTNFNDYVFGEITFESLDSYGRSQDGTTYMFMDPSFGGDPTACVWVDGELSEADKVFGPGEAVWFTMPGGDSDLESPVGLTDSGAVNQEDLTSTLREGCNAIGNFMAVDYPISDIEILNGADYVYGEISFESLDAFGRSKDGTTFMYMDPSFGGDPAACVWCDGELNPVTEADVLKPGQGIWFTSPMPVENEGDGLQIKFYAPDL